MLAMLLCAPSLWLGWQFDDDFHRLALTQPELPTLSRSPAELFVFIEGDETANRQYVVMGMLPWWSHEKLRIAFFRPLTGFTHWVDYKIWPETPSLMHLHSLVWLGGVMVAATFFYRRMFPRGQIGGQEPGLLGGSRGLKSKMRLGVPTARSAWIAGLAALLFAVDDAHGVPAVWVANRSTLIGVFFGFLTLIAHDRWRRDGSWMGAILAPVVLLLGLLSKESTVAIGAYLLAYALFLDRGTRVGRLCSLVPCALTGVTWWMVYRGLGYGAVGSGWYIDPGADLVDFAWTVAVRAPTLLAWQWLVPSDLEWTLSQATARAMWLAALGFLVIVAVALIPLLRRDAVARFLALGMVLSVPPACAAHPDDRLLFFVGVGAMGLLAQLVATVVQELHWLPIRAWWSPRARLGLVLCAVLLFIHLGVAPVTLAQAAGNLKKFGVSAGRAAASLPSDPAARLQTVLIVNTPSYSTYAYGALTRLLHAEPYLSRTIVLGSGGRPIEIRRPDKRTLLIRPEGGFLARLGGPGPSRELEQLLFDERCVMQSLDRMYRGSTRMTIGQRIELLGVTVEITATADDGRPAEAAFHFLTELESPFFRWMQWEDGMYVPFTLPAVEETLTLPAATVSFQQNHG
jgi:hypothetical protein